MKGRAEMCDIWAARQARRARKEALEENLVVWAMVCALGIGSGVLAYLYLAAL